MNERFKVAHEQIASTIRTSLTKEDPGHSENAWKWLLKLKPDADEVLQLAVLGHDIERALPDRLSREPFPTYDEYKSAHAKRAGQLVARIAKEAGYSAEEAQKIERLIGEAEFSSNDPEVQLICDADSISFFDYNIPFYLVRSGEERTKQKVRFMYDRASDRAKKEIDGIADTGSNIKKLLMETLASTKKTKSAGGVVLNKEGRVLVVSQRGTSWSLPKGHIEQGEDELTAAKREIHEEAGISELRFIKELGIYERYKISKDGGDDMSELKTMVMFLFETDEELLKPIDPENPEARWVKKEEVANLLTHPKDKEFFTSIKF